MERNLIRLRCTNRDVFTIPLWMKIRCESSTYCSSSILTGMKGLSREN